MHHAQGVYRLNDLHRKGPGSEDDVRTHPVFRQLPFAVKVAEPDLLFSVTVDGVVSGLESQIRGGSHLAVEEGFPEDCR